MIERNLKSKSARSILFEDFNDIDVYVEDSAQGYKKIYKEILNKAFKDKLKIDHILPIGNREEVIKECQENQEFTGRKRVYIVDGDLYLLSVNVPEPIPGLYVLPRYCIENFLLSEKAILRILYENDPSLELEEIANRIEYNRWLELNENSLIKLFIIYSLCKIHCPEEQTVGFKAASLCSDSTGIVCPRKTEVRYDSLKAKLIKIIGREETESQIHMIEAKIKKEANKGLKFISAKSYLMPLLFARIKNSVKSISDKLNMKLRLAIHSETDELNQVMKHIIE